MELGSIRLRDGRQLEYAEWGDADAPVLVYCHGFPGSRREVALAATTVVRGGVDVRVLAFNRPGYGGSSFRRGYRFLDWPADVSEAADRLGVGSFGVVGASGGCPFALACGRMLPDRVERVAIVAGSPPPQAPGIVDVPAPAGIPSHRSARIVQYGLIALMARTPLSLRLADYRARGLADVDRRFLTRPDVRAWFRDVAREAFASGGRAAHSEAELYRRPWGFDLGDVAVPAAVFHGAADQVIPPDSSVWLAERLGAAGFTLWPRHGHFSWAADDAVTDVVAWATSQS